MRRIKQSFDKTNEHTNYLLETRRTSHVHEQHSSASRFHSSDIPLGQS